MVQPRTAHYTMRQSIFSVFAVCLPNILMHKRMCSCDSVAVCVCTGCNYSEYVRVYRKSLVYRLVLLSRRCMQQRGQRRHTCSTFTDISRCFQKPPILGNTNRDFRSVVSLVVRYVGFNRQVGWSRSIIEGRFGSTYGTTRSISTVGSVTPTENHGRY